MNTIRKHLTFRLALFCLIGFAFTGCSSIEVSNLSEIDRSKMSAQQITLLEAAEEDYNAIAADQEPTHAQAKLTDMPWDGGSRSFEGEGYGLGATRHMDTHEGVHGMWIGPSITLNRRITGGRKIHCHDVRFVPFKRQD